MNHPKANKNLGQHFLNDQKVIESITSDFQEQANVILEIGPGPGILTKSLSAWGKPLKVIEKDPRFPEYLKESVPQDSIYLQDALEFDLENAFKQWGWENQNLWLVSNLPYNASSPLLIKFIQCPSINYMTLMFQREVADKIFAFDSRIGKSMNSLMALSQTYFDIRLLRKVPPGAFHPPPKVDSAVLSFERKAQPLISLKQFPIYEKFLRTLFRFKRKQVGKILKTFTSSEKIDQILETLEIDRSRRAESFHLEEIQLLYKNINSQRTLQERS